MPPSLSITGIRAEDTTGERQGKRKVHNSISGPLANWTITESQKGRSRGENGRERERERESGAQAHDWSCRLGELPIITYTLKGWGVAEKQTRVWSD